MSMRLPLEAALKGMARGASKVSGRKPIVESCGGDAETLSGSCLVFVESCKAAGLTEADVKAIVRDACKLVFNAALAGKSSHGGKGSCGGTGGEVTVIDAGKNGCGGASY